jgi:hypothetical protein
MAVNPISAEADFCFVFHSSCVLAFAKSTASALMGLALVRHREMVRKWTTFSLPMLCFLYQNALKMQCIIFPNASKNGISEMKCIKKCHFSGIKKCLPLHPLMARVLSVCLGWDPFRSCAALGESRSRYGQDLFAPVLHVRMARSKMMSMSSCGASTTRVPAAVRWLMSAIFDTTSSAKFFLDSGSVTLSRKIG